MHGDRATRIDVAHELMVCWTTEKKRLIVAALALAATWTGNNFFLDGAVEDVLDMSAFVVEFSNEIAVSLGISADTIIMYSVGSGSPSICLRSLLYCRWDRRGTCCDRCLSGLAAIRNVGRWTRCHGTRGHGDHGRACHDGDDAGGGASGPTTPVSPPAGDDGRW
jgi:hypothetical protein